MPIFEYVCKECDHEFEELVLSFEEPDPVCPRCQKKNVEKLMSVGSFRAHGIPKGSGGYKPPACGPAASR